MKRKVLCVFSLVAYLLLFCTVFAPMAQREMALLADVKKIKKNANFNPQAPVSCAQWEDQVALFQIVEGTGWNIGDRVDLLPQQYYSISSHVILSPGAEYTLIISASRTPQKDDLVEIVETKESPGEKLILYCPEGIKSVAPLQNNFTILQQSETTMLLDTMSIKVPYFEHRIIQALKDRIIANTMRIYSYSDAKAFLHQLPLLALIFSLVASGVILWGGTCLLTKKHPSGKLLWFNTSAIALTLLLMLPLTKAVDLPASLLPRQSILDLSHYCSEFSNIYAALASVGDKSLHITGFWLSAASVAIILAVSALSIMLLWWENKKFRD